MTRFWITLTQGVEFVMSSLGLMQGGEIFVPKIPSMRITDLANAVAPKVQHNIVGIRPGEKLHEVLVTEDDARMTLEMDDRYVIRPPQERWQAEVLTRLGARPVAEGFRYSSEGNPEWLAVDALIDLIKNGKA
jgi:UDP-N-acetylglucosamine 4,6-dehydratase